MRWTGGRRSRNVEDRRGRRIGRKTAGGGIGVVVIALIAMYFGVDPSVFLRQITKVIRKWSGLSDMMNQEQLV